MRKVKIAAFLLLTLCTTARAATAKHPIETVGAELRRMMPWIAANKIVDKSRN